MDIRIFLALRDILSFSDNGILPYGTQSLFSYTKSLSLNMFFTVFEYSGKISPVLDSILKGKSKYVK